MTLREALVNRVHNTDICVQHGPMVLDGGFGTMVQRYGLKEEDFRGYRYRNHPCMLLGNNEILTLTRPDVVSEIHKAYIEDKYASYILNEAEQYGVSLSEVKVTVVQDNHENWIPYEVEYTTHHLISAEFMKHIHNELGVAEERQYINDANDFQ